MSNNPNNSNGNPQLRPPTQPYNGRKGNLITTPSSLAQQSPGFRPQLSKQATLNLTANPLGLSAAQATPAKNTNNNNNNNSTASNNNNSANGNNNKSGPQPPTSPTINGKPQAKVDRNKDDQIEIVDYSDDAAARALFATTIDDVDVYDPSTSKTLIPEVPSLTEMIDFLHHSYHAATAPNNNNNNTYASQTPSQYHGSTVHLLNRNNSILGTPGVLPGHNNNALNVYQHLKLNDIYGQIPTHVKITTSESLNSYPQHFEPGEMLLHHQQQQTAVSNQQQDGGLHNHHDTSPAPGSSRAGGGNLFLSNNPYNNNNNNTTNQRGTNNTPAAIGMRTLSSLEGVNPSLLALGNNNANINNNNTLTHRQRSGTYHQNGGSSLVGASLLQHKQALSQQQNAAMSSIGLTSDGVFVASPGLSDALTDHIYTELSVSLGDEFVQYVQHTATLPVEDLILDAIIEQQKENEKKNDNNNNLHNINTLPMNGGLKRTSSQHRNDEQQQRKSADVVMFDSTTSTIISPNTTNTTDNNNNDPTTTTTPTFLPGINSTHIGTITEDEEGEEAINSNQYSSSNNNNNQNGNTSFDTSQFSPNVITTTNSINLTGGTRKNSNRVIPDEHGNLFMNSTNTNNNNNDFDHHSVATTSALITGELNSIREADDEHHELSTETLPSPTTGNVGDDLLLGLPLKTTFLPNANDDVDDGTEKQKDIFSKSNINNNSSGSSPSDEDQFDVNGLQSSVIVSPVATTTTTAVNNSKNNNINNNKKNNQIPQKKKKIIDLSITPDLTPAIVGNHHSGSIYTSKVHKKNINPINANTRYIIGDVNGNVKNNNTKQGKTNNIKPIYQQPTFQPMAAPVGSTISETKNHNQILYVDNIEEPISKTTFEQINFLEGIWPYFTRYIICFLTATAIAFTVYILEGWIGKMVKLLLWIMTTLLTINGPVPEWNTQDYFIWPLLSILGGWVLVCFYWIIGITFVYWGGVTAVRGSGLPSLNAYFDGSYDQNVPLFGVNVMIAKLISVGLSLGGLLKGGLQGPLIHFGSVMGRGVLKLCLLLANSAISHKFMAYVLFCCFDKKGHARPTLLIFPWQKRTQKQTSYIQSDMELVETLGQIDDDDDDSDDNISFANSNGDDNNNNNDDYSDDHEGNSPNPDHNVRYQEQVDDDEDEIYHGTAPRGKIASVKKKKQNNNKLLPSQQQQNSDDSNLLLSDEQQQQHVDSCEDFNLNIEREIQEYNNNALSPLQIGTDHDVDDEMTHRLHIFAKNGQLEYSDYSNPEQYENYIQSGYDNNNNNQNNNNSNTHHNYHNTNNLHTPLHTAGTTPQQYQQQQQQPRKSSDIMVNVHGGSQNSFDSVHVVDTTNNNNNNNQNDNSPTSSSSSSSEQQQQQRYQYHSSSQMATAAQHPYQLKGNDYQHVESLTLSKRIELICEALSGYGDEHDILACGAVAGFTCAFNAPIAGIIMIQSMLKQHSMALSLRLFFTALIAAMVSNLLRSVGDIIPDRGFVDLNILPVHAMTANELYFCIIFGAIGGVLGVGIIKLIKIFQKCSIMYIKGQFLRHIQYAVLLAFVTLIPGILLAISTSCTPIHEQSFPLCLDHPGRCLQLACPPGHFSELGSLLFANPERLVRLTWDRSGLDSNEFSVLTLLTFTAIYVILACMSALTPFPGGFFIPAIALGGLYGRLFSRFANWFFSLIIIDSTDFLYLQNGVYATLGSVAMLASINRLTLPTIVMMVEFTSDVQFLTPMMITLLSSKLIADYMCLGLEPEIAKLSPQRATMAMGELSNHFLGHVTARDILSINATIEGYPQFYLPGEKYPGQSDLAIVGEIDSIYRIKALLDTTSHSAYPVVSVLPSHLVRCEHTSNLSSRIYQRNILKSICQQYNNIMSSSSYNGHNATAAAAAISNLPSSISSLHKDLSVVGRSLSILPSSKSTLRPQQQPILNQNIHNYGSTTTGSMTSGGGGNGNSQITTNNPLLSNTVQNMINLLQSHHDEDYAQCKCQLMNRGHGKFLGLITRRNLKKLVERSVDYTRAIRLVASGQGERHLWKTRIKKNGKVIQLPINNKYITKALLRFDKLSKKTRNNNSVDTPATDGASIDVSTTIVNKAEVNNKKLQSSLSSMNNNNNNNNSTASSPNNNNNQDGTTVQHAALCTCFSCLMKQWPLIRYHSPILALLQHQQSKNRLLPIIANIYYQIGFYLKDIYKQQQTSSSNNDNNNTNQNNINNFGFQNLFGPLLTPPQQQGSNNNTTTPLSSSISTTSLSTTYTINHLPTIPSLTNIFTQLIIYTNNIKTGNNKINNNNISKIASNAAQMVLRGNNGNDDNYMLSLCHPVLLHRELLSTTLNYIASSLITLPPLPYHVRMKIADLSREKEEQINSEQQQYQQQGSSNNNINPTTSISYKQNNGVDENNDNNTVEERHKYDDSNSIWYKMWSWVQWLEARSKVRYSLHKDEKPSSSTTTNNNTSTTTNNNKVVTSKSSLGQQQQQQNTSSSSSTSFSSNGQQSQQQQQTNIITPTRICVSLVNALPLVDTGVYVTSYKTSGSRLWRLFRSVGMAKIVVVEDGKPVGIITRKDIVRSNGYLAQQMAATKTKLRQQ